jgi:hypothetical protein
LAPTPRSKKAIRRTAKPPARPSTKRAAAKRKAVKPAPRKSAKPAPKARPHSAAPKPAPKVAPVRPAAPAPVRVGDGRRHLLSLAFLRDGDEFLARLETDAGQITELKNRSLDQLLMLVAGELEDMLE